MVSKRYRPDLAGGRPDPSNRRRPLPPSPCSVPPGPAKVEIMAKRLMDGYSLWHPDDPKLTSNAFFTWESFMARQGKAREENREVKSTSSEVTSGGMLDEVISILIDRIPIWSSMCSRWIHPRNRYALALLSLRQHLVDHRVIPDLAETLTLLRDMYDALSLNLPSRIKVLGQMSALSELIEKLSQCLPRPPQEK